MVQCYVNLLVLFAVIGLVICNPVEKLQPCKTSDVECMTKSATTLLPQILAGDPTRGIPSVEPVFVPEIVGILSTLKFTLRNCTTAGYSNCAMSNVKYDLEKMVISFTAICPDLHMNGQYSTSGSIISLPIEGNGDFKIDMKGYNLTMKLEVNKVPGKDGKTHLHVKSFRVNAEATKPATFDFSNLFNGNKQLAESFLKVAHENWKEIFEYVQEPVINGNLKVVMATVNKYFKTNAYEDLFIE